MSKLKKMLISTGVLITASIIFFFTWLPILIDKHYNIRLESPRVDISSRAEKLHSDLTIVDLHADTLLWKRDLLTRIDYGHVDIERLIEGNVAVQVFSVVTKTPRNMNYHSNDGKSDNITLLALAQRWPFKTITSLAERTLYQAERLHEAADQDARFNVLHWKQDLQEYLKQRESEPQMTAGILAIEGMHALDNELANYDKFYQAGYRMMGLTHFFDNEVGGSAHGIKKGGLTPMGKALIEKMQRDHVLIDLAHSSEKLIDEVLANTSGPIVFSHTGVHAVCDGVRNIKDHHLRQVAERGGLIGIGYWPSATCGDDVESIIRSIDYVVQKAGYEVVSLGSDFDGAVATPLDTAELAQITQLLLQKGYTREQVKAIMGGNAVRLFSNYLPDRPAAQ